MLTSTKQLGSFSHEIRKKKNPVSINTKEMHANQKPKVLWYCSHNRQKRDGEQGIPWWLDDRVIEGFWDLLCLL